jgi:hypothetical protein
MRTSVKVRLGAFAAAAAIAASGAATMSGVADAATSDPGVRRLPTELSAHAGKPVMRHHLTLAAISGRLTSRRIPLRGKVVWLDRRGPRGHWTAVRKQRTHMFGRVFFRVHERRTSSFRLDFRGTQALRPSVSSPVMVKAGK